MKIFFFLVGILLCRINFSYGQGCPLNAITVAGDPNGVAGGTADRLYLPSDLAMDDSGYIYIADQVNKRIQKWKVGADSGVTVPVMIGAYYLGNPSEIFIEGNYLYIIDLSYGLERFDLVADTGAFWNSYLYSIGYGLYVDNSDNVFVSQMDPVYGSIANNRIQELSNGSTSAITVAGDSNGVAGSNARQLNSPFGIFVDSADNIYVADKDNNRIQRWAFGVDSGVTVAGGNGQGVAASQLNSPEGVYLDKAGNIYIADEGNFRIQKWMAGADSGITVAGGNGAGTAANQLSSPVSVFVNDGGNIFVVDEGNNRVQEFIYNANYTGINPVNNSGGVELKQNVPNPFSGETLIEFYLPQSDNALLTINDIYGRTVSTLFYGKSASGWQRTTFNCSGLSAGIYLSRLTANGSTITKKMLVE